VIFSFAQVMKSPAASYQEYMIVPWEGLRRFRTDWTQPKLVRCLRRVTTYNALRNSGARPVTWWRSGNRRARTSGRTVRCEIRVSGGGCRAWTRKPELAKKLGAHLYLDSKNGDTVGTGTAKTRRSESDSGYAPSTKAMSDLFPGLGPNGTLMAVGAGPGNIEVSPMNLLRAKLRLQGWSPDGIGLGRHHAFRDADRSSADDRKYPMAK